VNVRKSNDLWIFCYTETAEHSSAFPSARHSSRASSRVDRLGMESLRWHGRNLSSPRWLQPAKMVASNGGADPILVRERPTACPIFSQPSCFCLKHAQFQGTLHFPQTPPNTSVRAPDGSASNRCTPSQRPTRSLVPPRRRPQVKRLLENGLKPYCRPLHPDLRI
jgi:hypothetical protein